MVFHLLSGVRFHSKKKKRKKTELSKQHRKDNIELARQRKKEKREDKTKNSC